MKCISLWQPHASAVAFGSKRIETRHWATNYRGPLAIHAAKRINKTELRSYKADPSWRCALRSAFFDYQCREDLWDLLDFGAVVATCTLVDCVQSEAFDEPGLDKRRFSPDERAPADWHWTERQMGNFEPGRFGWVLDNVKQLAKAVPFKGLQGLFNVSDELLLGAA